MSPVNGFDFTLADILFRVAPPSRVRAITPPDEFALFLTPPGPRVPDAAYSTRIVDTRLPADPGEGVFWDNGIWRTRVKASDRIEIEIYDARVSCWRTAAHCSGDFAGGDLLVADEAPALSPSRPLYHPQDRAVILGRICRLGGVMMHSSCVLADGKVMLFVGMSGAGKTTLGRLWREYGGILLNDERNLLLPNGRGVTAGASPWHGEENQVNPATGPLAAVFFLNQAPSNTLRAMELSESLPRMLTAAFVPVFIPDGAAATLEACAAVLEAVPAYELNFTPDVRAVELCRSILRT